MKIKSMMILFFAIFLIIIGILGGKVNANSEDMDVNVSIGEKEQLDKGTLGFYTIQKKNDEGKWVYVTYSIIRYYDNNGTPHVAYCLDEDKVGVGYVKGDVDGYEVQLTKFLSDERIWRVIVNGYPYKTPQELGVETEEDAYLATKRAIYAMAKNYTLEYVKQIYRVGETPINNQQLNDIKRRGEKVLNAIYSLVNIGINGTQTLSNEVKAIKVGGFEHNITDNTYCQKYMVTSNVGFSTYSVDSIYDFPEGAIVQDLNGNARTSFSVGEQFKIVINKENINNDFNGKIDISARCQVYPIYYGEAPEDYQDYAMCAGTWDNLYASANLQISTNLSSLNIVKVDKDTKIPLEEVVFEAKYEDGTVIGKYTTDKNGSILINGLKPGKLVLTEIKAKEGYILDEKDRVIKIPFNEQIELEILNEKEPKADLKIIKKDRDTQERLEGVTFELKYEDGTVIGEFLTDENGEIYIEELMPGKVIIKELRTRDGYILNENEIVVILPNNEKVEIELFNEKEPKADLKIIKKDRDTQERLEGVTFELKYEDGTTIGEFLTDENGEIYIEELIPGKVIIKELRTRDGYILNEDEIVVILPNNEKVEIELFNEKEPKADLKIIKKDRDTQERLEGVTFELKYEDGTVIGEFLTDENGEIYIEGLIPGKVIMRELNTRDGYILEDKEIIVILPDNEEVEVELLNQKIPEKPLPRTGDDRLITNIIKYIITVFSIIVCKRMLNII